MDALVTTWRYIGQTVVSSNNGSLPEVLEYTMPTVLNLMNLCLLLWSSILHWGGAAPLNNGNQCPGYQASNVQRSDTKLTADLTLAGKECNIYGTDLHDLKFLAEWQTDSRLHVIIYDKYEQVYQVPDFVVPRPSGSISSDASQLDVTIEQSPFSFTVTRKNNSEEIFSTKGYDFVFESQYWRLRTSLPHDPSLYGLGEHTDPLRLPTKDYTRTMWARDAGAVPLNSNLYGTHPVYYEHRANSDFTHGVLLLNSNGMDIKINSDDGQYLEYNVLGGVADFYFLAGPTPYDVAREYSEISGKATMMPYWGFGFHQCRFGYESVEEVAAVVANYSAASIPLETMWTDIDYMDGFKVFTLGRRFPLDGMRKMISDLHDKNQHYIVMVDPAVAAQNYDAYNNGLEADIFLKRANGSIFKGRVWPGITAFPDWFHENTQSYWNNEFATFFDPNTGVDIDALWIDMNEPSNFCDYPCDDPNALSSTEKASHLGETGSNDYAQVPISESKRSLVAPRQAYGNKKGLPGRNLTHPQYQIKNEFGLLSNRTAHTDLIHQGGYAEYDTHNLYGTMMSSTSQKAMLRRRPSKRPMVITRSTFVGAGSYVGHWLGDNVSAWDQYLTSIRHLLQFVSFFQVPMVGADVCGFLDNTNEHLCARWTVLGAFYPFYRNHNVNGAISQEAYRWESVTQAAKKAIDIRYRLLDYIYTAMRKQTVDGSPMLAPLWMHFGSDSNTAAIDKQFFYGPALMVNPVTEENSDSVSFYVPKDLWYDFETFIAIPSDGRNITYDGVTTSDIPILIRSGNIIPMRVRSAMTTQALREQDFELIIAPDKNNNAWGYLYLDDGESLEQAATSDIKWTWDGTSIKMEGTFGFETSVSIKTISVLGQDGAKKYELDEKLSGTWEYSVANLKSVYGS